MPLIPLLDVPLDCAKAIQETMACLQAHQWHTVRSFNLQAARLGHQGCTCPYHGTAQCNCQMIVLLLYGKTPRPLTLVIHGREQTTHIGLVIEDESERWAETLGHQLRARFAWG